jgi:hypothetical protein
LAKPEKFLWAGSKPVWKAARQFGFGPCSRLGADFNVPEWPPVDTGEEIGGAEFTTGFVRRNLSKRQHFSLDYKYPFFQLERLGQLFISYPCALSHTIVETSFVEDLPFFPNKTKFIW